MDGAEVNVDVVAAAGVVREEDVREDRRVDGR